MPIITIDGKQFDTDQMSAESSAQLASLHYVDAQLQSLQSQIAVYQTARVAYVNALKASLQTPLEQVIAQGDTLKLG
jgi:Family of unknown function (DUF6447)